MSAGLGLRPNSPPIQRATSPDTPFPYISHFLADEDVDARATVEARSSRISMVRPSRPGSLALIATPLIAPGAAGRAVVRAGLILRQAVGKERRGHAEPEVPCGQTRPRVSVQGNGGEMKLELIVLLQEFRAMRRRALVRRRPWRPGAWADCRKTRQRRRGRRRHCDWGRIRFFLRRWSKLADEGHDDGGDRGDDRADNRLADSDFFRRRDS